MIYLLVFVTLDTSDYSSVSKQFSLVSEFWVNSFIKTFNFILIHFEGWCLGERLLGWVRASVSWWSGVRTRLTHKNDPGRF